MKNRLLAALAILCVLSSAAYAYFEEDLLKSINLVEAAKDKQIITYEDVDDLVLMPKSSFTDAEYITFEDLTEEPILAKYAEKVLSRFDKCKYTVVSKKAKNLNRLLKSCFYVEEINAKNSERPLRFGYEGAPFPYEFSEKETETPQIITYGYGIVGGKFWWLEGRPNISPDVSGCELGICDCDRRGKSHPYKKDAYSCLRKMVLDAMNEAEDISAHGSPVSFKINLQDRTPPSIYWEHEANSGTAQPTYTNAVSSGANTQSNIENSEDSLPRITGYYAATTGDVYAPPKLQSSDNCTKNPCVEMGLLQIHTFPEGDWRKAEEIQLMRLAEIEANSDEKDKEIPADAEKKLEDVWDWMPTVTPSMGHGIMRYYCFTWDEAGNLNPSYACVKENEPQNCYGFPVKKRLLKKWKSSVVDMEFPFKLEIDEEAIDNESLYDEVTDESTKISEKPAKSYSIPIKDESVHMLDRGNALQLGFISLIDNDLPNLVIRITNAQKPDETVYFPPVSKNLKITNSLVYYNPKKTAFDSNKKEYLYFISNVNDITERYFDYDYIQENKDDDNIYYKLLSRTPHVQFSTELLEDFHADESRCAELLNEFNPDVLQEQVRLEDFEFSDYLKPRVRDHSYGTLGLRTGTGATMTAYIDMNNKHAFAIKANTDYIIDIFADDNVKWSNIASDGRDLDYIEPMPTGVRIGTITVQIPTNQENTFYQLTGDDYDEAKAVNGGLVVRFEKPTPDVKGYSEMTFRSFPSIEATIEDYSGLTRNIKLYLRVMPEESGPSRVFDSSKKKSKTKVTPYHEDKPVVETIDKLK